jgi:hypothetical protein
VKPPVAHEFVGTNRRAERHANVRGDGNQQSPGRKLSARRLFRSVLGERIEPT